jgi:TetR/AcrR family transcriptional regulator, regulator of autoinduction and epiphytic fitness
VSATTGNATVVESKDGRVLRGERTRTRVAEALILLLEEGDPQPTAKEIAERAGVSLRLVFHHFEDMDALYNAVARITIERHWKSLVPVPADARFADRVERTVRSRARVFEAVSPVRRAAIRQASHSVEIGTRLNEANMLLREQVAATFEPELATMADRSAVLDAVDLLTSWETWERLRTLQRLSPTSARRVVEHALTRLLQGTAA